MKYLILIISTGLLTSHSLHASENKFRLRADSIMRQAIRQATFYENIVDNYEAETYIRRIETGIHQSIKPGLSERLSYNLSGGFFFNQHNTYFADFRYFAKHYFPEPIMDTGVT